MGILDLNICSSDFLVEVQKFSSGTDFLVKVQIFSSRYRFSCPGTDFLIKVQIFSSRYRKSCLKRISVPDEKICTLTRKSVPWWENMYPDEKICTLTKFSVPDENFCTLMRKSEPQMFRSIVSYLQGIDDQRLFDWESVWSLRRTNRRKRTQEKDN